MIEIGCTTFDYQKQVEFWAGHTVPTIELKARFRSLSEAKGTAKTWLGRNPEGYAKVIEIHKKVHEFHVRGGKP